MLSILISPIGHNFHIIMFFNLWNAFSIKCVRLPLYIYIFLFTILHITTPTCLPYNNPGYLFTTYYLFSTPIPLGWTCWSSGVPRARRSKLCTIRAVAITCRQRVPNQSKKGRCLYINIIEIWMKKKMQNFKQQTLFIPYIYCHIIASLIYFFSINGYLLLS